METIDHNKVKDAYDNARRRIFFLDYEGTLVEEGIVSKVPTSLEPVNELLFSLTGNSANEVLVISSQVKEQLEDLFNYLPLTLVAENGGFFRILRNQWQALYKGSLNWRDPVVHALSTLSIRFKGSSLEKKELSVGWNYESLREKVAPDDMRQFQVALRSLSKQYGLRLYEHDHTIEFAVSDISKGKFAANWVNSRGEFDFIMAIGNDWTDEELFETIGQAYFTIRVGHSPASAARYYLESQGDVVPFLKSLVNRPAI